MIRAAVLLALVLSSSTRAETLDPPLDVRRGVLELSDGRRVEVEGGAHFSTERLIFEAKEKVACAAREKKLKDEMAERDRRFWKTVAIALPVLLIVAGGAYTVGRVTR